MAPSPPSRSRRAAGLGARAAGVLVPLLVAAGAVSGCGEGGRPARPAAEPHRVYDLIERFSAAEIQQPTIVIDFGDPAAQERLLSGWSIPPLGDASEELPIFSRDAAELEFYVDRVGDLAVALRCAPTGRSRQVLSLRVNGAPWRELALERGMRKYSLEVPAELLRPGQNRLRIAHPDGDADAGADARGRVRWQWIRFRPDPAQPVPEAVVRADRQALFIPYGIRVDYYLELPPTSVLRIDRLRQRRDAEGRLRILWQPTGGDERILAEPSSGALELPLTADAGATGRLSFLAGGDGAAEPKAGGVLVVQPAVWTLGAPPPTAAAVAVERSGGSPAPNVVLYLIDTLRADHLGVYGYPRDTSPRIDDFAATAVVFENAQAQSPWTRSSVASVLTGLLPQIHRANDDEDALAEEIVTLAELLRAAGYRTAAVTGNGNAAADAGFAQGFDIFDHRPKRGGKLVRSSELNERAFPFLEEPAAERPFFLFVHTIDPHAPYDPPPPFRARFAAAVDDPELGSVERIMLLNRRRDEVSRQEIDDLVALYDAEIAANDHSFGALVDKLRQLGLYDNSLIILLADHGEEFYDHGGWTHGKTLHAEMLDTPLVVKLPGMTAGTRVAEIAQHIDVLPTVADVVGIGVPREVHGRSLLPFLHGAPPPGWSNRAVAHVDLRGRVFTSLIDGSWKIIQRRQPGRDAFPELYDRSHDRGEMDNVAAERPDVARLLVSIRRAEEAAAGDPFEPPQLDITAKLKMREELKALGYVQ